MGDGVEGLEQGLNVILRRAQMGAGPEADGVRKIPDPDLLSSEVLDDLHRWDWLAIAFKREAHQSANGWSCKQGCDGWQRLQLCPEPSAAFLDPCPPLLGGAFRLQQLKRVAQPCKERNAAGCHLKAAAVVVERIRIAHDRFRFILEAAPTDQGWIRFGQHPIREGDASESFGAAGPLVSREGVDVGCGAASATGICPIVWAASTRR